MKPGATATPTPLIEQTASGAAEPLAVLCALADGLQAAKLTAQDIGHGVQRLVAEGAVGTPLCQALHRQADDAVERDPRRGGALAEVLCHVAHGLNDAHRAAQATLLQAQASGLCGDFQRAETLAAQAQRLFLSLDEAASAACCDLESARAQLSLGHCAEAQQRLLRALAVDVAHTLKFMGLVHTQRNEHDQAERALSRAQDIYAQVGNDFEVAKCERSRANVSRAQDRLPQAVDHCQRALQIFEAYGHEVAVARCAHTSGVLQYTLNRYAEAKASYEKAVQTLDRG